MAEAFDIIGGAFGHFLNGFALSKAMLEDYASVVAKIENVSEQEVKDRIDLRRSEIYEEVRQKLISQIKEHQEKQ